MTGSSRFATSRRRSASLTTSQVSARATVAKTAAAKMNIAVNPRGGFMTNLPSDPWTPSGRHPSRAWAAP